MLERSDAEHAKGSSAPLDCGDARRSYDVALRVSGPDIDIEEVSQLLSLKPTDIEPASGAKGDGIWSHTISSESGSSFADQLRRICDVLEPRVDALRALHSRYDVHLWCAIYYHTMSVTYCLPPDVLSKLTSLGIELWVSAYPCDDESSE